MNHLKTVAFAFVFSVSLPSAWARMDADYRCEKEAGGVAIKLPSRTSSARIWQTEPGDSEGLEMKVTEFKSANTPGVYDFSGMLEDVLEVRGRVRAFKLTYEAFDPQGKIWIPVLIDAPCVAN